MQGEWDRRTGSCENVNDWSAEAADFGSMALSQCPPKRSFPFRGKLCTSQHPNIATENNNVVRINHLFRNYPVIAKINGFGISRVEKTSILMPFLVEKLSETDDVDHFTLNGSLRHDCESKARCL
jgi:hypothetical protein